MSKKLFLFGTIASVIAINSVFADTIVTSKSYVDTTRQATIPVAGTNENTPGSTVVTYTATNLPMTTTTKKVCTEWVSGESHSDENCLLWNLTDQTVYGYQCYTADDCQYPEYCSCVNNMCECRMQ